jgi:hypothetical protein
MTTDDAARVLEGGRVLGSEGERKALRGKKMKMGRRVSRWQFGPTD